MPLNLEMAAEWLRLLCQPDTPGQIVISSHSDWAGARFSPGDITGALFEIKRRGGDPGVYLRMGTIKPSAAPRSRGTLEDTETVFGLWADIDIDGPGHKHDPARHEGRRLPPDRLIGRDLVKHLPEPTVWVESGGGLYPLWLPIRPWRIEDHAGLTDLSVDMQHSIAGRATELGWHYGTGVGDLARVLRIPGTLNRKTNPPADCVLLSTGGPRYEYGQLREAIPCHPVAPGPNRVAPAGMSVGVRTRLQAPARPDGFEDSPLDLFAERSDFGALLELDGWWFVRQVGARKHYARPGKKPSEGVSANLVVEGGRQVLYVFSESAGLPVRQALSAGQWYACRYHGGDLRAATRELRGVGYGVPRTHPASTGANPPAPVRTDTPGLPVPVRVAAEGIWEQRPILRAIHGIAKAQMVGPWAVLGSVLAHVCCRIGPHVVLPAIVGSKASLNLFVGLVGPSGAGKDAAIAVAEELMQTGHTPRRKLGTGQGIDAMFSKQTQKHGPVQFSDVALMMAPEVDTVDSHSKMSGSTLMSTLREVYSGSDLGAHYADQHKRRPVRRHSYRAAVIAGIQPARSQVLLADADGGTPQRWLWMPTNASGDDTGPKLVPPSCVDWWTDYDAWQPVGEVEGDEAVQRKMEIVLDVCDQAVLEVRAARAKRLRSSLTDQSNDMAGHMLLTRLKVAAILGFLERRTEVVDADWELAGRIIGKSEETRAICSNVLAERATQNARSRGKHDAIRQQAAEEVTESDMAQRALRAIMVQMAKKTEWSRSELRRALRSTMRDGMDEAIDMLMRTGQIRTEQRGGAVWYVHA